LLALVLLACQGLIYSVYSQARKNIKELTGFVDATTTKLEHSEAMGVTRQAEIEQTTKNVPHKHPPKLLAIIQESKARKTRQLSSSIQEELSGRRSLENAGHGLEVRPTRLPRLDH